MFVKLLIFTFFLTSCSTYNIQQKHYIQDHNLNKVNDPIYESTLSLQRIANFDGDLESIFATGVVVKNIESKKQKINSYVLSVEHFCKKIKNKVTVISVVRDNEALLQFKGKVLLLDKENDLCLIKVYNTKNKLIPIKISSKSPKIGDKVMAIGGPETIFPSKTEGYVISNIIGSYNKDKDLYMTLPASGGSSGSAIYNKNFELVGLLKAGHLRFKQISVAVPLSKINNFLDSYFSK